MRPEPANRLRVIRASSSRETGIGNVDEGREIEDSSYGSREPVLVRPGAGKNGHKSAGAKHIVAES